MTAYPTLDARRAKSGFLSALQQFAKQMEQFIATNEGDWTIKGFIDVDKNVYTISLDSKIVSKILEIHLFPQLQRFAQAEGYQIVLAEHQNWYPDLSFVRLSEPRIKFAVDIKTTYRDKRFPGHINGFTLGSHGAYFRDRSSTKNIQFPYSVYLGHICLGIIYSRVEGIRETEPLRVRELGQGRAPETIRELSVVDDLQSITSVIRDFQFFVCEKWQLASDRQGSGNTANIGSITAIDDIMQGNGVFSKLGEDWFDEYWMNYGLTTMKKGSDMVVIRRLDDFLSFKGGDKSLIVPMQKKRKQGRKS